MERIIIILTLLISSAELNASVIDLGNLEIEGEVRQPKIQFFRPDKTSDKHLKHISEKNLILLEQEIFANLKKIKGLKNGK